MGSYPRLVGPYLDGGLSTSNPYGHLNLKWVARDPKSSSNRVPIWETYFGLPDRHKPNLSILSPDKPICRKDSFLSLVVGEDAK